MTDSDLAAWWHDELVLGVPTGSAIVAVLVALTAYLVMALGVRAVLGRLSRMADQTATHVDDGLIEVLGATSRWLMMLVAVLLGAGMLDLPGRWEFRLGQLWFVVLVLQGALWASRGVSIGMRRYAARHAGPDTRPVSAAAMLFSWGLRTLLWAVAVLAVLSNIGVNITAFIASLGVGGIAIALAAQQVLGDLFASVAIAVDKPFEVGDFITFTGVAGTVEVVGIKTTRIRSLGGEQIVMSNTELLKQTVSNFKRLMERRIVFGFGVTYDTTAEQAEAIAGVVRKVIESSERLRFDRAHFKAFGDSSLHYEVVYFVLDPSYAVYMDEQQRVNVGLMRSLAELGVEFAFPTRTVHVLTTVRADIQ